MTIQGNNVIINQICSRSGLSGSALEALRVRLNSMSEEQLQAELSSMLAGGGGGSPELDLGVTVERTAANERQNVERLQLKEAQCKEVAIQVIDDNITDAYSIFNSQYLGAISGTYDELKGEDNKLATSNVKKVLDYQQAGMIQMIEAKNNNLTRRAYYEENKQRIKDMILTRLNVLETPSGVKFIDEYRGKYSREQLTEIIDSFIERICSDANIDKLKQIQKQFVTFSAADEMNALRSFVTNAKDFNENGRNITINTLGGEGKPQTIKGPDKGLIPSYWDSAEPITFEEVYKIERGLEYSQYAVEHYTQTKAEMETVVNAFNKKQQFVDFTENLSKEQIPADAKAQKIIDGFAEFYSLSEDGGRAQLQKIIEKSKLPVLLDENGLNLSAFANEDSKNRAMNSLLKIAAQEKEKDFETFLGGKSIEEYQASMENAAKSILGEDDAQMLADAMKNDNMTVIQRWTGNTSMAGMALTVVGGVLCFTPAAPLGAAMVTVGNTVAIGGMVAKTGLGVADYATKDVQTAQELTDLSKDFVMDAGGFIIGMGAGKAGMQAFSKLIDKKLVAVFGQQISQGNKAQALKTVFTDPEYLKSFMTAGGAKLGTDFMISYAGDLAMMGILDTRDDWRSLLQANLTGVLVGMSGDVKDAAGVGKVKTQNNIPRGLTSEENVLIQRTREENPASGVERKVQNELQHAEVQTGAPEVEQPRISADNSGRTTIEREALAGNNKTPQEYKEFLNNVSQDEFIDELSKFVYQDGTPMPKEELDEFKASSDARDYYKAFQANKEFFMELLEKDVDGRFLWGNEDKHKMIFELTNELFNGIVSDSKELLSELNSLKSIYGYIETVAAGEKPDGSKLGLSEKKVRLLDQLIKDKRNVLDDEYEINRIIKDASTLRSDADIDYMLSISNQYGYTINDASNVLKYLRTPEQRANFKTIADLGLVNRDKAIIIAQVMELPGAKERLQKVLDLDTDSEKIDGLNELADDRLLRLDNVEKLQEFKLLEYPQLTSNNIINFLYYPETINRLMERKLLEDSELQDGDMIYRLASFDDKSFSTYKKIQSHNGLSKEDACEVVTQNYYIVNQYEKLGLSRFKTLKTAEEFEQLAHELPYMETQFKARSEELVKAEHLTGDDIITLCSIQDELWPRVQRRGLLENENITTEQIKALSRIDEELYSRVLELGVIDKISTSDDLETILRQPKAVCERYFELKENLPEGVDYAKLSSKERLDLAFLPPERLENVCKFLKLDCKRSNYNKLGVNDINILLSNFNYTIEQKPEILDKMLEFADMKLLEEQGAEQLCKAEISDLTQLYFSTLAGDGSQAAQKFEKTMELITNPERNRKNLRIPVSEAIRLSNFILDKARDVESTQAERNDFINDLIYIPERGSEQLSPQLVVQLANDFRTSERLAEYKEFLYSPERKNVGANQLSTNELSDLFVGFADKEINVEHAKKLLFIDARAEQQLDARSISQLANLSQEELAKIEKYFYVANRKTQLNGKELGIISKFDDKALQRLDRILACEDNDKVNNASFKAVCQTLDDVQFENFMALRAELPKQDTYVLLNIVQELKEEQFEHVRILIAHNSTISPEHLVGIAKLEPARFQRAVAYLKAGKQPHLAEAFAKADDVKIEEKFDKAISEAKAKRNQLKSGLTDLTDYNIEAFFNRQSVEIIATIDMLGLPTFTHSYTSKLTGVEKLVKDVITLQSKLSTEDFARLKQNLADKSIEPQDKISKLQAISALSKYLDQAELNEYIDLIKPNTPTKAETKLAKEIWANPKARFDDKFTLFCETFGIDPTNKKVIDFFEKRATVNAKGYKILNGIKENEVAKLLEIEVIKKRNMRDWNEALDKKIFATVNVAYSPELSAKLNLTQNKYLEQVLSANSAFKDNFGELVDELVAHPDLSIRDAFNQMPHNLETRRQFEEFGIDYDRWVDSDVNSYRSVVVSTNAEKTKQAAIENLEADFNDPAFKAIPEAETKKIFDALEQLGIKVVTKQEPVYDIDGFVTGYKDMSRFYENDAPIEFNRLPKVISAIKKVMNENDFWTKSSNDATLNQNIETVYNHIMKLRDAEITNAAKLKDDEVSNIEVHKTNMNDVSHSLFLGNHGACCTAVGTGCNQYAAPRYCMDKCISAIEVMDGKDFVGNSMCYFATVDGELALVLDNIELNGKYQYNDKIRDTFMDYAKQLCEEVGKPDIPIYAGPYRHKLNMTPYETAQHDVTIIGSTGGDATYIDFVTGRYIIDGQRVSQVNLFKIK